MYVAIFAIISRMNFDDKAYTKKDRYPSNFPLISAISFSLYV